MSHNLSSFSSLIVKVAENAAIACYDWVGKGKEKLADMAAVEAMRKSLNEISFQGRIVIGEGERDEAPMLYIGEEVGKGSKDSLKVDIALDPLEGTTICAHAGEGSLAVIAIANHGGFLHAPDVYMEKIAVGAGLPQGVVDLDNSVANNLKNLAKAKKCDISDLKVLFLKRDRHEEMVAKTREAGARVKLIGDGDVAGVISCCDPRTKIDCYMGTGGAPEGVLAAAALRVTGGQIMGRLLFHDNQKQIDRAKKMGIKDLNKKYTTEEMAKGDVVFVASGVTDGAMLKGVRKDHGRIFVESLLMDSSQNLVRHISTEYLK